MKCESCGGVTLWPDATRCRHCGAIFVDPLQKNALPENSFPPPNNAVEAISDQGSWRKVSQVIFMIAASIWYLPLVIGLLGFVVRGFHPEGLRLWLLARNGPMLIFAVGEMWRIFVLPIALELLMLPFLIATYRFRIVWPLGFVTFATFLWAMSGVAIFALSSMR